MAGTLGQLLLRDERYLPPFSIPKRHNAPAPNQSKLHPFRKKALLIDEPGWIAHYFAGRAVFLKI
jgi:hypothetical protein